MGRLSSHLTDWTRSLCVAALRNVDYAKRRADKGCKKSPVARAFNNGPATLSSRQVVRFHWLWLPDFGFELRRGWVLSGTPALPFPKETSQSHTFGAVCGFSLSSFKRNVCPNRD